MKSIKDLIYFDLEKAKSLISQLHDGLISEISRAVEDENEDSAGLGFDLKIIKGNTGEKVREKVIKTEKINLYHEILNSIENNLEENGLLTSLNDSFENWEDSFTDFVDQIHNFSYIKSTGWGSFEDFERFKRIFSNFNNIQRLIFSSQLMNNPELIALNEQLADAKKVAAQHKDRNVKSKELNKIKAIEKNVDKFLKEQTDVNLFDEEWIKRIKIFLDTFSPNRLNFRLLPFDGNENFQILANLKDKYMLDGNFENTIFTYGSRPNIKLTVVGIITSCPRKKDVRVHPNNEYIGIEEDNLSDESNFDKAFRRVFDSFEAFEKFFFVPSYPKIAISPIAIYREVIISKTEKK